ncbi:MBL fold metallo-hydrolase [Streptomyces afghaniensis]|uniref:MBL fold metallo-hydrolase n=1 Tax=Streptomyces afghaniensis TaxID=66865 RepID=UPI0037A0AD89
MECKWFAGRSRSTARVLPPAGVRDRVCTVPDREALDVRRRHHQRDPRFKTDPSPVTATGLGRVDAVLLSHDEHDDNLDNSGRAFLPEVPVVLTTVSGAGRLGGNARGLAFWQTAELQRPDGGTVTVTGVPARHGPVGCEPVSGDVVGFVLTSDDLPSVYVSGDNAALEHVKEIAEKFAPVSRKADRRSTPPSPKPAWTTASTSPDSHHASTRTQEQAP